VPKLASAKKALRQSHRRAARNRTQRSALRTALKRVRAAATQQDAMRAYGAAVRLLDRAARQGLIHANNAARHKSRLARYVKTKT